MPAQELTMVSYKNLKSALKDCYSLRSKLLKFDSYDKAFSEIRKIYMYTMKKKKYPSDNDLIKFLQRALKIVWEWLQKGVKDKPGKTESSALRGARIGACHLLIEKIEKFTGEMTKEQQESFKDATTDEALKALNIKDLRPLNSVHGILLATLDGNEAIAAARKTSDSKTAKLVNTALGICSDVDLFLVLHTRSTSLGGLAPGFGEKIEFKTIPAGNKGVGKGDTYPLSRVMVNKMMITLDLGLYIKFNGKNMANKDWVKSLVTNHTDFDDLYDDL